MKIDKFLKSQAEKINTNFEFENENISYVLEAGFELGSDKFMPYHEDMYTVKKDKNKTDINAGFDFIYGKDTMIPGYVESKNTKVLDLTGKKHKLVKSLSSSIYHIFFDDFAEIINALKIYPDAQLILNISQVVGYEDQQSWNFLVEFLNVLKSKKVKYRLVNFAEYEVIHINNFSFIHFPFQSGIKADLIFNFFSDLIDDKDVKPTKKVFVSRKLMESTRVLPDLKLSLSFDKDVRLDNVDQLERYFFDELGYEIIYPENFTSFKEQINYFYSVKTIVSVTSSGLINATWMQPGGNVIELVTPLLTDHPSLLNEYSASSENPLYIRQITKVVELHAFYHNIAFLRDHLYIGIPNYYRSTKLVKEYIESNSLARSILEA